jgi:GH35 family endo-1,4-beta-xylanase
MKPDAIWGPGGVYDRPPAPAARLVQLDELIRKLQNDGFKVIGHTLLWHAQSPNWLNLSAGRPQYAEGREYKTYAEARENLELFINTAAGHWHNHLDGLYIHSWDVINEAVRRNQERPITQENWGYHTIGAIWVPQGEQWNSPWYMAYANQTPEGANPWDYVYDAFKFARLADPSAILYYNDYNMEYPDKVRMIVNMVNAVNLLWTQDENYDGRLLIEGIGMQQHDALPDSGTDERHFHRVENAVIAYISTGAKISITELDVGVRGYTIADRLSEADEIRQGIHYARLFQIFKKYSEHIERVTFWGVNDRTSWRANELCQIFDADNRAKLAYFAVADPDGFLAQYAD